MNSSDIRIATEEDREQVLATVLVSFSADPMLRWLFPEANAYLKVRPLFNAFCGGAIDQGAAYMTPNHEGVAMWFPPGFGPDEERFIDFLQQAVRSEILEDVFHIVESMGEFHPAGDCWYLPVIGVDPAYQGKGLGAALMKRALLRCDKESLPAYLESSNPRNINLYERHGFEIMGRIQSGSSPELTPMIRLPAS